MTTNKKKKEKKPRYRERMAYSFIHSSISTQDKTSMDYTHERMSSLTTAEKYKSQII